MKMPNDASVSDWIGTAKTNAGCAARALDRLTPVNLTASQLRLILLWVDRARGDVAELLAAAEATEKKS